MGFVVIERGRLDTSVLSAATAHGAVLYNRNADDFRGRESLIAIA